jgi:hypothetical protein
MSLFHSQEFFRSSSFGQTAEELVHELCQSLNAISNMAEDIEFRLSEGPEISRLN